MLRVREQTSLLDITESGEEFSVIYPSSPSLTCELQTRKFEGKAA